jgi:hypothetical protein
VIGHQGDGLDRLRQCRVSITGSDAVFFENVLSLLVTFRGLS